MRMSVRMEVKRYEKHVCGRCILRMGFHCCQGTVHVTACEMRSMAPISQFQIDQGPWPPKTGSILIYEGAEGRLTLTATSQIGRMPQDRTRVPCSVRLTDLGAHARVGPLVGRLAQWESASFTRKRPLVRYQYRPPYLPPSFPLISAAYPTEPSAFLAFPRQVWIGELDFPRAPGSISRPGT